MEEDRDNKLPLNETGKCFRNKNKKCTIYKHPDVYYITPNQFGIVGGFAACSVIAIVCCSYMKNKTPEQITKYMEASKGKNGIILNSHPEMPFVWLLNIGVTAYKGIMSKRNTNRGMSKRVPNGYIERNSDGENYLSVTDVLKSYFGQKLDNIFVRSVTQLYGILTYQDTIGSNDNDDKVNVHGTVEPINIKEKGMSPPSHIARLLRKNPGSVAVIIIGGYSYSSTFTLPGSVDTDGVFFIFDSHTAPYKENCSSLYKIYDNEDFTNFIIQGRIGLLYEATIFNNISM